MPRKFKKVDKAGFSQLDRVWTDISTDNWLMLFSDARPEARFTRQGEHIKGHCPLGTHDDRTPSFYVTPIKGIAKCFACRRFFKNPIFLAAAVLSTPEQPMSVSETMRFLRKRFGLKSAIPEALYARMEEYDLHQSMKNRVAQFTCEQLLDAITAYPNLPPNLLPYQHTVEYLMSRRLGEYAPNELRPASAEEDNDHPADPWHIWPVITANQLVGVFPPLANVAAKFGSESEEYKFFHAYFGKYVNMGSNYVGHIILPWHDSPSSIAKFKLRKPDPEGAKEMITIEDAFDAENDGFRGYYGLHYFRTQLGPQENGQGYWDTAYLVEGEFDALASIAQQVRRQDGNEFVILAGGGASVESLDPLARYGIKTIGFLQDRDYGGDTFVKQCFEQSTEKKLSFRILNWPDEYANWTNPANPDARIKDADDAVRELGYPKWARYVSDDASYYKPQEWCFQQASRRLQAMDPADVKARGRIAVEWGKFLTNHQECQAFCKDIEANYGLDATLLFRDINAGDEDEEGFIMRVMGALGEDFHFIGIRRGESRKTLLDIWNKHTRAINTIVINDEKNMESVLANYYGSVTEFVRDKVGEPGFMTFEGEDSPFKLSVRKKRYREYVCDALVRLSKGLPSLDYTPVKAQGIHFVAEVDGECHAYVVNGRDVFHIITDAAGKFDVSRLDGPSDRGFIFDNADNAWLHSVKSADDLKTEVSLPDLYRRIKKMVEIGWAWKYQSVDVPFLAAHIMALSIMPVMRHVSALMVNAERASGKSRFTSGLIGGVGYPQIHIVAHATVMQGYTPAGIRQSRHDSTLTLCLEEFEDYGTNDSKSMNTRRVLELTRDMNSETGVTWSIGTTTGEARKFHLKFPMVCCAIKPLRDAASLSRFVCMELINDDTRQDPIITLTQEFGAKGIATARHELAVGLLRHIPRVRQIQSEIEAEFASGATLPQHASSRFRELLFPALIMLKLVTEEAMKEGSVEGIAEYRQLAYDFSMTRKEQLARLKTTTENEQVFETLLSSNIQINDKSENRVAHVTTLRVLLADLNNLDTINKTQQGVYIDKHMDWIVVNWIEATQGLLSSTKYHHETPTYLKHVSERSPYHVTTEEVRKARVLDRLVEVMGPCQPLELISVFSVRHILDDVRRFRNTAMTAPVVGVINADAPKNTGDQPETVDDIIV